MPWQGEGSDFYPDPSCQLRLRNNVSDSRKNRFFLETALAVNFINKSQCDDLLNELKAEERNSKTVPVFSLIEAKNMLAPDDLRFLCELAVHLEARQLDHTFISKPGYKASALCFRLSNIDAMPFLTALIQERKRRSGFRYL